VDQRGHTLWYSRYTIYVLCDHKVLYIFACRCVLWKICNKKGAKGVQLYVQCFQYGGLFTAQEWPEGSLPLIPEKGQFAILDTERVLNVEPRESDGMGSAREMTRPGVYASF
jgi:hypothetical protein